MPDFIETEEERKRRIAEAEAEMRKAEDEVLLKANPEKYWAAKDKADREAKWEQDFGGTPTQNAVQDSIRKRQYELDNAKSAQVFNPVVPPNWPRAISAPDSGSMQEQQDSPADIARKRFESIKTYQQMRENGLDPVQALVKSELFKYNTRNDPTPYQQAQMQRWNTPPPDKVVTSGGRIYKVGSTGATPLTDPVTKPTPADETPEMQTALRDGISRISKGEKPSAILNDYPNLINSPTWKSYIGREVSAAMRPKSQEEILLGGGASYSAPPPSNPTPNARSAAPSVTPSVAAPVVPAKIEIRDFNSEEEALKSGVKGLVTIKGRKARID